MPRSVHERLQVLESDVRDLRVLPAAAVRARGRQRGRRQLTVLLAAGAVVAATAGVGAIKIVERPDQSAVAAGAPPRLHCVLALPDSPADVRVRVLDGEAAAQLRARRFSVIVGPTGGDSAGAATLRYGPKAIGAATVLRAAVHGEVLMRFDPGRTDEIIDLTLGPAFTRLATATETNENLAAAGVPSAPPECATAGSAPR